ncbi:MAG TPA: hypothetical protein VN041_17545 [Microbacterium sp.]|nr:hypothetical protein [Microbacterium sp.]
MTTDRLLDAGAVRDLDHVKRLWAAAGIVSFLGLAVTAVLAFTDPADVNWVMWLRGIAVTVACFAFILVTAAVRRGSRRAYTRMRLVATIAPIGVALLIVAPDSGYPGWMKVEQAVLAIPVIVIAVLLWRRRMRQALRPAR